ncbi:gamma-glutamyltransferase family protein [Gymnodinialimonas ceratoperidinii]|uniref:Gamma-glutamyltransferase family protein n=1 Tax=Gymnodinialimonas ceratoperidinii TaxID=2856823 RepID=A0A8F6TYB3_9RHOB|nr:gamma-glutamyltransferase family protein [Gymnodinialimonas ceratoperidinii]QXT40173.1 gamma-glutamyltransferase family protein [Gymnodinialimonas ceratoperidinii]
MRDFHQPGRSAVFADNGMCATSHPLAAQVAISLLQQGGNAVDAAIGAAILLGLCEPQSTGIGGDMFALVAQPDGEIIGLNGSGRAPAGLSADALRAQHDTMPLYDISAVTVPGAVDGFCRLHEDHGKLPLADVLAPSIHYADAGIPIAPRVALDYATSADVLQGAGRRHYLQDDKPLPVGARFKAPGQAEVLRRIAAEGRAGFYEGEVLEDMLTSLQALGGTHTAEDFAKTACNYVTPLRSTYRDAELIELPPNGQGATAMLILNMLETLTPQENPFGTQRAHLEAEATKLGYDARDRFLADPDHVSKLDHFLSKDTAARLAGLIDPDTAMPDPRAASDNVHKDTVYITVVDSERRAVSLIYSVFHSFGSGFASDKFGILFQNRGGGFTLEKGHPNEAGPGKRPLHTIIPGVLKLGDGSTMPFGVMGGAWQSTGHARFVSNVVDYGMDPQAAIDAPRAFAEGGEVRVERGYSEEMRNGMAQKGHKLITPLQPIGGAQAIRIHPDGVLEGGSDPRKDGIALGY